jgi:putative two-component system response regulator
MEPNTQPPGAHDRLSPWLSRLDEMETSDHARYREVWLHEARVGWLSSALAREIGCPGPDCLRAFRAGRFHDVGKLETPDAILFKNGRLSSDEQREMRRHTTCGTEILTRGGIPVPKYMLHATAYHHERYAGGGYAGLRGEGIPFIARIVALADVFDAMRADRSYKSGTPEAGVLRMMTEDSQDGRRAFDPALLRAFVGMRLRMAPDAVRGAQRAELAGFAASDPQGDLPPDSPVTFSGGHRMVWAGSGPDRRQAALITKTGEVREIRWGPGLEAAGLGWAVPAGAPEAAPTPAGPRRAA